MEYRVVFLDHGRNAFSVAEVEAESDDAVVDKARRIFASGIGMGYEILRDEELVHIELYTPTALRDSTPSPYAISFLDAKGHCVISQIVTAPSQDDALQIAAVLFDACSDVCASYEVWNFYGRIRQGVPKAAPPPLRSLREQAQATVIDLEIALRDSHTAIAESKRLQAKLEEAKKSA